MKRFDNILEDIKNVQIQGARNIALAGMKAFLLNPGKISAKQILSTRPTEPLMQNSINFLLKSKNPKKESKKITSYIKKSDKRIAKFGAKLIKNDMNVFTHCHSFSVMNILKEAKKKKHFVVYNTETRPLFQGRTTSMELADAGIKVIHVPDSAAGYALRKCDLFLFGSDAFTEKGVANKIGTSMFSEIAKMHNISRYSCGISLKFAKDIKLEFRSGKEVWDEREKNIKVMNPAFDLIKKEDISGIVSEFGILKYENFIKKAKENLKNFS